MNIKEKELFGKFFECVDNCSYTSNFADENAMICVKIADEYAVDFAYWLTDSGNKNVKGQISIEELLNIYKNGH